MSKTQPHITVCVPTFNCQKYVRRCLSSISAQTYRHISIEIVDDASTDKTLDIISEFKLNSDMDVSIFRHTKNSGGMGQAVKESMDRCCNPFYMWMASDDELDPVYIENLIGILLDNENVDYAYSDFALIDESSNRLGTWKYPHITYPSLLKHVTDTLSGVLPMVGVFRTSFFRSKNLSFELAYRESFSSDTLNSLNYMKHGMEISRLNRPLFKYRKHDTQTSHRAKARFLSDVRVLQYIFTHHLEGLRNFTDPTIRRFFECVNASAEHNVIRFKLDAKSRDAILKSVEYTELLSEAAHCVSSALICQHLSELK